MQFILKILLTAIAVLIIEYILPGVTVDSYVTAIWVALILGILYAILKPILVVLTLPVTIVTLGLFLFVINALIVLLTNKMVDGFDVSGFWVALIFSILLSIVQSILYKVIDKE
ncbi:MAG: phage holin family protein [Bacteroidota bacterium]